MFKILTSPKLIKEINCIKQYSFFVEIKWFKCEAKIVWKEYNYELSFVWNSPYDLYSQWDNIYNNIKRAVINLINNN